MLRARALEQALRMLIDAAVQTACKIAEDGDRRWHVVDLVCATNDAEKLLAVDPPPSGASPQAETSANVRALTVHICDDCLNLRGEMCNEPGCRFCRRTMAEVAEYLDVLLIRPRIDGVSVLVDEGAPLTNCGRSDV